MTINVLLESSGVLAVAKPAGVPTQAPPGIDSVESLVRDQRFGDAFVEAIAAGSRRHPGGFLGVPHRLDRPVSGVLLLATTPRAARQLSRQFERRQVTKTYLAVVSLTPEAPPLAGPFEWRDMIRKVPDVAQAEIVLDGTSDASEAITKGQVLATSRSLMLLALEPLTGRMHQLRVQTASRGIPVLGDSLYGGLVETEHLDPRSQPIALHAWRIGFHDPETGAAIHVACPPPNGRPWSDWTLPEPINLPARGFGL
jgi:23S rRNA-/tRNA-specific pseudouridylate synthase